MLLAVLAPPRGSQQRWAQHSFVICSESGPQPHFQAAWRVLARPCWGRQCWGRGEPQGDIRTPEARASDASCVMWGDAWSVLDLDPLSVPGVGAELSDGCSGACGLQTGARPRYQRQGILGGEEGAAQLSPSGCMLISSLRHLCSGVRVHFVDALLSGRVLFAPDSPNE